MARSATLDMTQGSLGRQIIGFSLPLMFTNLLQMLFSMVDLAVVGRFSSSAAMGSGGSRPVARPRRSSSCSRAF